jgi:hypothetical protein
MSNLNFRRSKSGSRRKFAWRLLVAPNRAPGVAVQPTRYQSPYGSDRIIRKAGSRELSESGRTWRALAASDRTGIEYRVGQLFACGDPMIRLIPWRHESEADKTMKTPSRKSGLLCLAIFFLALIGMFVPLGHLPYVGAALALVNHYHEWLLIAGYSLLLLSVYIV